MSSSLLRVIDRFPKSRILVLGDLMLDEFIWGRVSRISPEAPVPVVWVQSESVMPGGAANVANNLRSLGAEVTLIGVAGRDRFGDVLLGELSDRGIDASGVLRAERPTIVKTRVIAHHQQVVRVDREQPGPLSAAEVKRLVRAVEERLREADALIIEDYGKGLVTRRLLSAVIPRARRAGVIITVDPKEDHFELYRGVSALTPNRAEAALAVGRELADRRALERAGAELVRRLRCEAVLITLGEDGMELFERSGRRTMIPTVAQEVFDVAGAGDTVIAAFTLALAAGAGPRDAARLSNYAAGIVVGKLGVACCSPGELRALLRATGRRRR
ncbi:MAG TPA: D-glycero-beta-D-manno-heptose-7-phosphate kinase [bacterium]